MSAPLKTLALLALLGLAGCGNSATTSTSAVSPPAGASQIVGGSGQVSAAPALTQAQLAAIAEEDAAVQAAEQNVDGTVPTQTR